jgi:hypothetical protein
VLLRKSVREILRARGLWLLFVVPSKGTGVGLFFRGLGTGKAMSDFTCRSPTIKVFAFGDYVIMGVGSRQLRKLRFGGRRTSI